MSARDSVLAAVRRGVSRVAVHPGAHPAPPLDASFDAFAERLAAAGGEARLVSRTELGDAVATLAREWAAGGRIVAEPRAAERLGATTFESARSDDPASYADVAVAIASAAVGVAENGAVAVLGADAPHRSLLFLAERLILLVEAAAIVGDLHSGLRALPPDALRHHHVTWIAGPSKSADIEQALVFGAHGPRALAVLVYEAAPRGT